MKTTEEYYGQVFHSFSTRSEFAEALQELQEQLQLDGNIWKAPNSELILQFRDRSFVFYNEGDEVEAWDPQEIEKGYWRQGSETLMYNCSMIYDDEYGTWSADF